MFINNIEKQVIAEEKELRHKFEKPLYKVLHNEDLRGKIVKKTIELAKKEDFVLDTDEVEYTLDEIWDAIKEDFEYVPGYVDEYVQALEDNFYNNGKVNLTKVCSYIMNRIIG